VFATDVHRDRRIFPWLDLMMSRKGIVAIGGDLDDPCLGSSNLKFNYIMHKLRPNSVRDKLLAYSMGSREDRLLVVLGNHDNPDPRSLHGKTVTMEDGLVAGGIGGSLPTGPFPFQLDEGEYESMLGRLGHVDILIVHQPPFGTRCDVAYSGEHLGSRAIRDYVLRERPRLVLTGHIHESPAIDRLGGAVVINPGPFFGGSYGLAEISGGEVRATIEDVRGMSRPER
jgi:Icc-related predicted phosphoesterase